MNKIYWIMAAAFGLACQGIAQNVGIGTAVPTARLDVAGALAVRPAANITAGTTSTLASNVSSVEVTLVTGGIGTTINPPITATEGQVLFISNRDDNVTTFASLPPVQPSTVGTFIFLNGAWRRAGEGPASNDWTLAGNAITGTEFIGTTNGQPFQLRTNNLERARIDAAGNMGIGVVAPAARLHVQGATSSAGLAMRVANASAANLVNVLDNGQVIFGDVGGAAQVEIRRGGTAVGGPGAFPGEMFAIRDHGAGVQWSFSRSEMWQRGGNPTYTAWEGNMILRTNTNPGGPYSDAGGLSLSAASGNVTVSQIANFPNTARFNVRGAGTANTTQAVNVINNLGANLLMVLDDGNTGIGTAMPTARLHVAGQMALTHGTVAAAPTLTIPSGFTHLRLTLTPGGGASALAAPVVVTEGQLLTVVNEDDGPAVFAGATIAPNGGVGGFIYANGIWRVKSNSSTFAWNLAGNAGTNPAANFVGTTDGQALIFRANNIERMRINPVDGEVVVGAIASPLPGDMFSAVSSVTLPFAVNGYAQLQNGCGVFGTTATGNPTGFSSIQGEYLGSGGGSGVRGVNFGTSTANTASGVAGSYNGTLVNGGVGVLGTHATATGNQRMGVLGMYNSTFTWGLGVVGLSAGGALPAGNLDIAVVGWRANNAPFSGYFNGNHAVVNGTKSASVGTSRGNQLLYVTETPEVWFEDIGRAQLVNGEASVQLDPLFLETVFIDATHPMHVFLQAEGDCNDLYVLPGTTGFVVREKNGGTSSVAFSYRVMAKRLHFQDHRFGNDAVWGPGDTRKYNEYATPPPVDYNENVRFQEEMRRRGQTAPYPPGFTTPQELQQQLQAPASRSQRQQPESR